MSESTARRPYYVYLLSTLALSLFVALAARTIDLADSAKLADVQKHDSEVIIITRPAIPDVSQLREDISRLREETDKVRFHVEMLRDPAVERNVRIHRQ